MAEQVDILDIIEPSVPQGAMPVVTDSALLLLLIVVLVILSVLTWRYLRRKLHWRARLSVINDQFYQQAAQARQLAFELAALLTEHFQLLHLKAEHPPAAVSADEWKQCIHMLDSLRYQKQTDTQLFSTLLVRMKAW